MQRCCNACPAALEGARPCLILKPLPILFPSSLVCREEKRFTCLFVACRCAQGRDGVLKTAGVSLVIFCYTSIVLKQPRVTAPPRNLHLMKASTKQGPLSGPAMSRDMSPSSGKRWVWHLLAPGMTLQAAWLFLAEHLQGWKRQAGRAMST